MRFVQRSLQKIFNVRDQREMTIKNQYKVIIAGGRHFNIYELLKGRCDYYLQNKLREGRVVIISVTPLVPMPLVSVTPRDVGYCATPILPTGTNTDVLLVPSATQRWQ